MQVQPIQLTTDSDALEGIRALFGEARFQTFIDHHSDGVIVIDRDGQVVFLNSQARHLNDLGDGVFAGRPADEFLEASSLNHDGALALSIGQRKREFLLSSASGQTVLGTLRLLGGSDQNRSLRILVLRDLQLIDHQRRVAAGDNDTDVFRFMSHRDSGPDFETQRRISDSVDRTLSAGYRAVSQGARLLLTGESGSGKTEIARYLHRIAGTAEEPFVHVNCGAIPDSLFESEMFGYERGAFTDALRSGKQGLIESAEGGTLFLDEVGEIPITSQAKLLKFLEDGMVQRIGSRRGKQVRLRLISATNRDLWQLVGDKLFRSDLYYRLAVINLEVKPLREQPALIEHLIGHFVSMTNRMRQTPLELTDACYRSLCSYNFHGNIRELHNLIQHLSVVADAVADIADLPQHMRESTATDREHIQQSESTTPRFKALVGEALPRPLKEQVKAYESGIIAAAIRKHGTKRKAAKALGVDIGTIVRKTRAEPAK